MGLTISQSVFRNSLRSSSTPLQMSGQSLQGLLLLRGLLLVQSERRMICR